MKKIFLVGLVLVTIAVVVMSQTRAETTPYSTKSTGKFMLEPAEGFSSPMSNQYFWMNGMGFGESENTIWFEIGNNLGTYNYKVERMYSVHNVSWSEPANNITVYINDIECFNLETPEGPGTYNYIVEYSQECVDSVNGNRELNKFEVNRLVPGGDDKLLLPVVVGRLNGPTSTPG